MRTRTPLVVGRSDELAWLDAALAGARAHHGTGAFIAGEEGIGKTRLTSEVIGHALDAGTVVLRGRCSATGPPVPFRPLTEALLSIVRMSESDIGLRLGPYRPILGRLVPDWAEVSTPAANDSLIVLAEAVLRLTTVLGEGKGCLLVIDDLQDADVETLAVLEYLVGNAAGTPLLVLGALRTSQAPAVELARTAVRRGDAVLLELERLTMVEVRQVIAGCLNSAESAVPDELVTHIYEDSAGNPLLVEELLQNVLAVGNLVPGQHGWQLTEHNRPAVPMAVFDSIAQRAERLGTGCLRLLSVAALFGRGFPISPVQRVLGVDGHELFGRLRAAAAAGLVAPDERGPDWYMFQHPMIVEAILSRLTSADRVELSAQAAEAVIADHPDLPGEWSHLAASLRVQAGQRWAAADLYVGLGRRAIGEGAPGTAVATLDGAIELLGDQRNDPRHHDQHNQLLNTLLFALAEAGQFDRALQVADELILLGANHDAARQVEVHVRLAWAAQVAGRWAEGATQVTLARSIMSATPDDRQVASVDAVDAYLTMSGPVPDRVRRSEELGRSAVAAARRSGMAETTSQALYAVGYVVRDRDIAESDRCFHDMLEVAASHHLVNWRNYALIGLGGNSWLADADQTGLRRAREHALQTGSIALAHNATAVLGLDSVLRGEFGQAAAALDDLLEHARRIKLVSIARYALMAKTVLAAHRGDRQGMRAASIDFQDCGGNESSEVRLVNGLGLVFCALLEEDRPGAHAMLDEIAEDQRQQQSIFHLAGPFGLKLLLDVMVGDAGFQDHERISGTASGHMRWNRQFVLLAHAVLLGREGKRADACAAFAEAASVAQPFPTARHLGLRLVAEAAADDGWGQPSEWLREAEEHFHGVGVVAVASACRAQLRRAGVSIRQRRSGTERVPEKLRRHGVTSREYEVFELLPRRLVNKAIAERLHISVRTVEKHVASLLMKTGVDGRAALSDYACELQ
jgi:DNA-binding CsgD family transcriptional regulator